MRAEISAALQGLPGIGDLAFDLRLKILILQQFVKPHLVPGDIAVMEVAEAGVDRQLMALQVRRQRGDVEARTVVAGDSLSKIAKEFYGDAKAYPRIFEANRDILDAIPTPIRNTPLRALLLPGTAVTPVAATSPLTPRAG